MLTTRTTSLSLTLLFMSVFNLLKAQLHYDWAVTQGSRESDYTGSCRQDDQGHIYTMCFITDTADLDPGIGEDILIPRFDETTVLSKWTTDGEYLWSGIFHTQEENGGAITQLKNNSILIYLHYTDSLVYVQQNSTITLSVNPGEHLAILTLDLEGNVTSFRDFQDNKDLYFTYLSRQDDGSILTAGSFTGSMTLTTSNGDTTIHSQGQTDGFIISFNSNWVTQWVRTFASEDDDFVSSIYLANDQIYYAIGYNDTMTLITKNGLVNYPCANSEPNGLFGTITLDGQYLTAQSFGGDFYDDIRAITADDEGNIYICGSFKGTVNFEHPDAPPVEFTSTNGSEGFISRYSPDGFLQWTRIVRSSNHGVTNHIKLHRNEWLYIAGTYNGHTDLDPGPDSILVESNSWGDIYSAKFDKNGNMQWTYNFVGQRLEGIRQQIISPDGKVYLLGFHNDPFDADPSINELLVPHMGNSDMFLIALAEENVITASLEPEWLEMSLFPNPATDEVYITANTPIESVRVSSFNGASLSVTTSYSLNSASLRVESLQPGIYLASVKTTAGYTSLKFIRQ